MPAAGAGGVPFHVAQERPRAVGQLAVRFEHLPPSHEVGARVDEDALGLQPIASGASRFLLIVFRRPRRTRMDDEPHVRPIDAHAEGDGRDDDIRALVEKCLLMPRAYVVGQAGMIRHRAVALVPEPRRERLHFAARRTIDDPRLVLVSRQNLQELTAQARATEHPVQKVGPIERAHENDRIA